MNQTFSQQEQRKREIGTYVNYQNRNLLKTIGELPAEYRPIFKDMFDELTKQIVEAKLMSFTDGGIEDSSTAELQEGENKC